MNMLYTFGCSHTAHYNSAFAEDYKKYKGGFLPPSWPELLSKKLDMRLNNLGVGGASNYEIFQTFCNNIDNFVEGDVIIIGWSYVERFRLFDSDTNQFVRIGGGFEDAIPVNGVSLDSIQEIILNRQNKRWTEEVCSWEKAIKIICNSMHLKLMFWSFDEYFNEYKNIYNNLLERGALTIYQETNNEILDYHFGETAHIVQAEYFFTLLNGKNTKSFT